MPIYLWMTLQQLGYRHKKRNTKLQKNENQENKYNMD